jgi:hypothetical protein
MPTENKPAEPGFDLNTPDDGRGYIAHLFKTVLKRHDYRQYISDRLAGDFACTLAQYFEDLKAREQAMQLRLNAADQRIDELTGPHQDGDEQALIAQHQWFVAGEFEELIDNASDFQDKAYALGRARGLLEAVPQSSASVSVALPERKPSYATAPDNDMRARLECKHKGYNEALDDVARLNVQQ